MTFPSGHLGAFEVTADFLLHVFLEKGFSSGDFSTCSSDPYALAVMQHFMLGSSRDLDLVIFDTCVAAS